MNAKFLDGLRNHIMKSDIERLKSELAKEALTEKERISLFCLANDVALMRLKYVELYAFKKYSKEEIEYVREWLPASVLQEISEAAAKAEGFKILAAAGGIFGLPASMLGFIIGGTLTSRGYSIGAVLMLLPFALPFFVKATAKCSQDQYDLIMRKIFCVLKQKYEDAISIKQLINDIEILA